MEILDLLHKFKDGHLQHKEVLKLDEATRSQFVVHMLSFLRFEAHHFKNAKKLFKILIPESSPEARFVLIKEMTQLIQDLNEFEGEVTFEFLDSVVINSLTYENKKELAEHIKGLMQPSHVSARVSNLWGLVRLVPYLDFSQQKDYVDFLLQMARENMDKDLIFKALYSILLHNKRQQRLDVILHIAKPLQEKSEKQSLKILVLDCLHTSMALILEDQRAYVMDAMLVGLTDEKRMVVEKVLSCFPLALESLPTSQRQSYCMMLTPLAKDPGYQEQVHNVLRECVAYLQNDAEKKMIHQFLSGTQNTKANSNEESLQQPLHIKKE